MLLAAAPSAGAEAPPALRVAAEVHTSMLSIAAGAGLGLLVADNAAECWGQCRANWIMVGAVTGLIAAPFATWGVGRLLGAQGDLLGTWTGLVVAMQFDALLTAIVFKLVGDRPREVPTIAWVLAGTLAIDVL